MPGKYLIAQDLDGLLCYHPETYCRGMIVSLIISEMRIVTIKYGAKIENLYSFKTLSCGSGAECQDLQVFRRNSLLAEFLAILFCF